MDMRVPAQRHANVEKSGTIWRQSTVLKVWKKSHVVITKESLMFWYLPARPTTCLGYAHLRRCILPPLHS